MPAGRQFCNPQLLARLGVERPEPVIVGRSDEHESARRRDATADVSGAGLQSDVTEFGQRLVRAKRRRPGDFTLVDVDRDERAVWGRVTRRHLSTRQAIRELLTDQASTTAAATLSSATGRAGLGPLVTRAARGCIPATGAAAIAPAATTTTTAGAAAPTHVSAGIVEIDEDIAQRRVVRNGPQFGPPNGDGNLTVATSLVGKL